MRIFNEIFLQALRETDRRHHEGKEQLIDWDAAKRELHKRAE
jgi:hypothetical protein